jgi:hypothetical protein
MKSSTLLAGVVLLCLTCASQVFAGEIVTTVPEIEIIPLEVREMAFCAGIKNKAPVAVADTFPSDVYSVYCFTRIVGAKDTTAVVHTWYHEGEKMAGVRLPVRSAVWRTWSSKRMWSELRGEWRVDVTTPGGEVIESKKFHLE